MDLLQRLFPPRCLLCGDPGHDGLALCAGCDADLPRIAAGCRRCGAPLPASAPGLPALTVCGPCLWRPPPFVCIHVPFRYAPPVDWLVRRLKFQADLAAGRLLGELLARELAPHIESVDAVAPVPLHPRRLDERGFNQAAELARPLSRRLGARLAPTALERRGSAVPQMELSAERRRANVRGAFVSAPRFTAARVLVVDDVVTTASTMREAARGLARVDAVLACAVARA